MLLPDSSVEAPGPARHQFRSDTQTPVAIETDQVYVGMVSVSARRRMTICSVAPQIQACYGCDRPIIASRIPQQVPSHELPTLQETDAEPDRISVAGLTPDPSGLVAAVARNADTAV